MFYGYVFLVLFHVPCTFCSSFLALTVMFWTHQQIMQSFMNWVRSVGADKWQIWSFLNALIEQFWFAATFVRKMYNSLMSCSKPGKHIDILYSENVSEPCFAVTGFTYDSWAIYLKKLCLCRRHYLVKSDL